MNANFRNFAIWIVVGLLLIAVFNLFQSTAQQARYGEASYSEFWAEVDKGNVRDVTIAGNKITGHYRDNRGFQTYAPDDPGLVAKLQSSGVRISAKPSEENRSEERRVGKECRSRWSPYH